MPGVLHQHCGFLAVLGMCAPGQPEYEHAARRSLHRLWSMRTPLGLFGTSLDMSTASWLGSHGGIGASADSFYEYLLKAYVLFGGRFLHTFALQPASRPSLVLAVKFCT